MRNRIIFYACGFVFALLFMGLLNLQLIRARKFKALSEKNCVRLIPQEGSRGRIFDISGQVIVDNQLTYDIILMQEPGGDIDATLERVSQVLGTGIKDIKKSLKAGNSALSGALTVAENIDRKKAFAIEELKPELNNAIVRPRPVRLYPYGKLACHVLGYLGEIDRWRLTKLADYGYKTKDTVGFGGVEERYDYYLRQEEGGVSFEVDHRGRFMGILGLRPAQNGKDIQLTIDLRIQRIAQDCLQERPGSVVIMDPYSGQIKAMASAPGFNPGLFSGANDKRLKSIFQDPDSPLINRAISAAYPAGSVFKMVVACAGLEARKINFSSTFKCAGSMRVGGQEFSCWDTHEDQELLSALKHSCNIFFYRTGLALGAQPIYEYALKLGLSKAAAIDLSYEASGFIPSPLWKRVVKFQNWFDGDTVNLSIGQGYVLVTPLQVARMTAVFANRQGLVTPYIVAAIDGRDTSRLRRKIIPVGIKAATIDYVRQGLRKVVSEEGGTAHILSGLTVDVAGKTGTAQVTGRQPHAWFTGFFPYRSPKFVICVLLEHGGSGYNASVVAKNIIENMQQQGLI